MNPPAGYRGGEFGHQPDLKPGQAAKPDHILLKVPRAPQVLLPEKIIAGFQYQGADAVFVAPQTVGGGGGVLGIVVEAVRQKHRLLAVPIQWDALQQIFSEANGVKFFTVLPGQQPQGGRFFPQGVIPAVLEDDFIEPGLVRHRADEGPIPGEWPQDFPPLDLVFPDKNQVSPGFPVGFGDGLQGIGL